MAIDPQNYVSPGGWNWELPQSTFQRGQPLGSSGFTPTRPPTPASTVTATPAPTTPAFRGTARTRARTGSTGATAATPSEVVADNWQTYPGMTVGNQGPIYNMWDPASYEEEAWKPISKYLQSWYLPQQEAMQNAYQWGSEYDEAQRRWDESFMQQDVMNQYGMGLQTRQQQMAEWEANEATRQWAEQFGWTQETDRWTQALAQEELAQREMLQQMQNQAALQQARMSAFGRAEAPTAKYRRNWS